MGLSFSLLALSRDGVLDLSRPSAGAEADAAAVVQRLFPRTPHQPTESRPLLETAFPPRGTPVVGVFDSGVLVATRDAHLYDPGILHARYRKLTEWPDVRLLTAASVNDMFAYGRWRSGELTRCLSVNAVAGVVRDHGTPDPFEADVPVSADNWLDLCNAALRTVLGLQGDAAPGFAGAVPWEDVTMHVFDRAPR
ncbi:DUF6928 family protein [Nocardioides sp. CPCC 205120]|uniref:DUF6928 family protein n=1 Tax=Nocardioides sp. CPCC 205120 TaxID=3406462 RepID=UPI003B51407E